ncbi:glutamate receptor ionotropic, NMDA 3B-like [Ornithodoros turicata]|uniref:glutamate receptor ionotropic, NMDA 3B-like n=1 Tax=Ornithodoros turicata TaxID=34597 RepID=UPI00313A0D1B
MALLQALLFLFCIPLLQSAPQETAPALLVALPENRAAAALARALRRALGTASPWLAATIVLPSGDPAAQLGALCQALETHVPLLMLSLSPAPAGFAPALAAGTAGLPVIAYTGHYGDASLDLLREVGTSELYLNLDPGLRHLTDALFALLSANRWYEFALVAEESAASTALAQDLVSRTRETPWRPMVRVALPPSGRPLLHDVGQPLLASPARVVVLFCGPQRAVEVLEAAAKLGLLRGEHAWLIVEPPTAVVEGSSLDEIMGADGTFFLPPGLLRLRLREMSATERQESSRWLAGLVLDAVHRWGPVEWPVALRNATTDTSKPSCWDPPTPRRKAFSKRFFQFLKAAAEDHLSLRPPPPRGPGTEHEQPVPEEPWFPVVFDILNLAGGTNPRWRRVGNVTGGGKAVLDDVEWPGGDETGPQRGCGRQRFRVVTAYAPPFVMPSTRIDNGSCLTGVPCLQVGTAEPERISAALADYRRGVGEGIIYNISCCAGMAVDLLAALARDLAFDFDMYLAADGTFGTDRGGRWTGVTQDLISGAAHLAASAYSVTSQRSRLVDFSVPFFHSGVSCLAYPARHDVPLSAFLVPFSVPLWVAIFFSLKATAVAAALYEWFSPFGLNPWGRQRTKNFSLASALWVMWSLLFSHLVAFKAPKSWPNKVLINLWGCFSVIFLASYTANIAAHFAGLFFQMHVHDFHDTSLLSQRTGTARGTAAEGYVFAENKRLWEHIQRFGVASLDEGLASLREGTLDVLIGDTAVLNYFRANEPGCRLRLLGDSIFDDAYAVGMQRGFPLKRAVSDLLLRYNALGFLDQLQRRWYGRAPCLTDPARALEKPLPLGVRAVAGVFIMLLIGLLAAVFILIVEHFVFRYALPGLRRKPKDCFWRSPNLMFFSQKLYRFVNTVELVSPHHSAKEIMTNLREGQIASLFQKSVKRKIKEEARRRKSKSQFFEMIQEIRKVVQQQRDPDTPGPSDPADHVEELVSPESSSVEPLLQAPQDPLICVDSPAESSRTEEERPHVILSASLDDLRPDVSHRRFVPPPRTRSLGDLDELKRRAAESTGSRKRRHRRWPVESWDDLRLVAMSKEEVVRRWQDTERRLLNLLRETLREKQALERRVNFLRSALLSNKR